MAILHQEIPDDLHRQLKIAAAEQSVTLKDLIIAILRVEMRTRFATKQSPV